MQPFVHLHIHSEFSIFDSVIKVEKLIDSVARKGMPAVALTDLNNLFGAVKFYKKATACGVKPIFGVEIALQRNQGHARLVLLCMNNQGLDALRQLISNAYLNLSRDPVPIIPNAWLNEYSDDLIAVLIDDAELVQAVESGELDQAAKTLQQFASPFSGRFYISLSKAHPQSAAKNRAMIALAQTCQLPVVATNDVVFLESSDFEAHETRVCIQEGTTLNHEHRTSRYTQDQYLKSSDEMHEAFKHIPSAVENAYHIAQRCNVQISLDQTFFPQFPVPEGESVDSYLEHLTYKGLQKRYEDGLLMLIQSGKADYELYKKRLKRELDVILSMGFAGYFLIVADFIQWGVNNKVPVGPGRGSGAGSLVAYALGITGLDPLQYDLLFERFLNPERVSMPDFDIDFCMEKRDRVIEYVAQRYGRECVSQIATFGTMAAKAVVRDVGRVLGHPYGYVDKIAKLIPFEIGMTLSKALVEEEALLKLYKSEEEVRTLIDLAKKLEGLTRNVGKHAGGVVIAPDRLTAFTPLYCEEGSHTTVSQYDKDDVEAIGLVKFDFLGLRTLTIIDWAVAFANQIRAQHNEPLLEIESIPLDCPKTYEQLKACQTTAVFQLESRGMKDLIHRLQPDEFEEIIALVALFRPGPLQSGMVDDFINRKHGRAIVEYPHPDLEPILKPTYGVILYQEQVMQIAQTLAGYTLGGADLLRRAMGKKKPEEMAKQREIFVEGATARGVDGDVATGIFDLMEKFAGYGFNKSHSAAYALVSYQTAWLKTHYPAAFMASVLSSDMAHTDKLVNFVMEVHNMGLVLRSPDVNSSEYRFVLDKEGAIIYGLGAIKGVGEGAIESIIEGRKTDGPYQDLFDLCLRVDSRKVNRRVLEALIKSGCLDSTHTDRSVMIASIDAALKTAEQQARDDASGQVDMFAMDSQRSKPKWNEANAWTDKQRLKGEKDTLGFYLTGHPISSMELELSHFVTHRLNHLPNRETKVTIAGMIHQMRTLQTKRGDRMAFVTLDDSTGLFEVAIFSDLYQKCREYLTKDELVVVIGTLSYDTENQQTRIRAEEVLDLASARARYSAGLRLKVGAREDASLMIEGLQKLMQEQKGSCPVVFEYSSPKLKARLRLGPSWQVLPSDYFIDSLKQQFGEDALVLDYA